MSDNINASEATLFDVPDDDYRATFRAQQATLAEAYLTYAKLAMQADKTSDALYYANLAVKAIDSIRRVCEEATSR